MTNTNCSECGAPIPTGSPGGACPACLLRLTMADGDIQKPWQVLGDYEIFEEIARGGMGIVYRARQRRLGRAVAVKVLRGGEFAGVEAQARFRTEAAAAARLQHPGIVAIHDVGEDSGVLWFSMDLVLGGNLDNYVRDRILPSRDAAKMLLQIAEAVQHAHENGVLHRDLKPSNILIADGHPRITDFGLARCGATESTDGSTELTRTGQVLGSPGYAAPEQALEGKGDARTDVYGLGAVLYHLLTARPPFQGPTLDSILIQLREGEPISPRRLDPTVPRDLDTICMKCLSRDPSRRYESAASLGADVQRFLEGKAILARPTSAIENVWRWCRRHPATAALLALLFFGTVAAFVVLEKARASEHEATVRATASNAKLGESLSFIELRLVDENFQSGDSTAALGALARILRRDPAHPIAGPRLASALWHGDFAMPKNLPFYVGAKVQFLNVLDDGKTLVVGTASGPKIVEAETGKKKRTMQDAGGMTNYRLSPDGRILAGWNVVPGGVLAAWDIETGRLLFPPLAHSNWLQVVHFSADSSRLLAPPYGADLQWRDARTGTTTGPAIKCPERFETCAPSSDGRLLAINNGAEVSVWNWETQSMVGTPVRYRSDVLRLIFSADDQWLLVVGKDSSMQCFRVNDGTPAGFEMHLGGEITDMNLTKDKTRLVAGSATGEARVWTLPQGEAVTPLLKHRDYLRSVSFSPDGRAIVTCSQDNSARLWDAQTGRPLSQPIRHGEQPHAAAFTPDGTTLYTGGADRVVQRWDVRPRSKTGDELPHAGRVIDAQWSGDGRFVASIGGDNRVIIRDAGTLAQIAGHTFQRTPTALRFSPDSRMLLVGAEDGLHALRQNAVAFEYGGKIGEPGATIESIAFTHDGARFAIGQQNGSAIIYDSAKLTQTLPPLAHSGTVSLVEFSADGSRLLTCSTPPADAPPGGARLWNTGTGASIGDPMVVEDDVVHAAFSPNGTLIATAGNDNIVALWDGHSARRIGKQMNHERTVCEVVFSPDGNTLASAAWDGSARLWDAQTGEPRGYRMQHDDRVLKIAFSRDGKRFATASRDKTVRLWDAATGLAISEPLRHDSPVQSLSFHPQGERLLTVSDANSAHVWTVPDFSGTTPEWLITLSDNLALEGVPHDVLAVIALVGRSQAAIQQALAAPANTAHGKLGQRLFAPKPTR